MPRYALLILLAGGAPTLAAQSAGPALALHGLEPGITQSELQDRVGKLGGRLRCRRSVADRRLTECLANIARAPDHNLWSLRASIVNGTAAILLLSASLETPEADRLRDRWIEELGRPNRRNDPGLETYEWNRNGRTMRLTAHGAGEGRRDISVSLVQTAALASLGAAR
jgi:hypothetical protein